MFSLKEGEVIENEIRRHWFVMVPPVLGAGAALLLPVVVLLVFLWVQSSFEVGTEIALGGGAWWFLISLYLLWMVLVLIYLFVIWSEYYLDVWYITNIRLVDIDQKSLFNRSTKSLRFERVQDVTVEVQGLIATLLKFGTVHVQTAGAARQIDIKQVKRPYEVRRLILQANDRATNKYYKAQKKFYPPPAESGQQPGDVSEEEGL